MAAESWRRRRKEGQHWKEDGMGVTKGAAVGGVGEPPCRGSVGGGEHQ